jgi:hypothetical protein
LEPGASASGFFVFAERQAVVGHDGAVCGTRSVGPDRDLSKPGSGFAHSRSKMFSARELDRSHSG